jgi:hypothetical protein
MIVEGDFEGDFESRVLRLDGSIDDTPLVTCACLGRKALGASQHTLSVVNWMCAVRCRMVSCITHQALLPVKPKEALSPCFVSYGFVQGAVQAS